MIESILFLCIKQRLLETCPWLTDVRMYNQQDIFQELDGGYNTPIVFVDFQDIVYDTITNKAQEADLTVVIKLVNEQYDDDYLEIYKKKDLINNYLNFWGEWDYNLERVSESTDTNADSMYVYDIFYNTRFKTENFTFDKELIGGTSGTQWNICLDLDLTKQWECLGQPPTNGTNGVGICDNDCECEEINGTNGLNKDIYNNIGLGGRLSEHTTIKGNAKDFVLGTMDDRIDYTDIHSNGGMFITGLGTGDNINTGYTDILQLTNPDISAGGIFMEAFAGEVGDNASIAFNIGHNIGGNYFGVDYEKGPGNFSVTVDEGITDGVHTNLSQIGKRFTFSIVDKNFDKIKYFRIDEVGVPMTIMAMDGYGLAYDNNTIDEANVIWATDNNHIPSIQMIKDNVGDIQTLDNILFVSKLRGGTNGVAYRYDLPFDNIQDAIDTASSGEIVRVIDGTYEFPVDNFILKDNVDVDFLRGTKWLVSEDDNSIDKSIGRIAYNTTDVNCSISGYLDVEVIGHIMSGASFARLFALVGDSNINIEIRDVYASSKPGLITRKGCTILDTAGTCTTHMKIRDVDALSHKQFAISNLRQDSKAFIETGDIACYRCVSTRNNAEGHYVTKNCTDTNYRVGDESKATWIADSITMYQGEFYVSPNQNFIGESTSIKIDTPWIHLGLRNSFTNGTEMVVGQFELKHANVIGFTNKALGHSDDYDIIEMRNYVSNALTLDNVKLINNGTKGSVLITTLEAGESKIINSLGTIVNNNLSNGVTSVGTLSVDNNFKFNFSKTPSNFPGYVRIMWEWSNALCVLSGGNNNGNYRRKTITSGQYLESVLDNSGYTPIILDITDAFSYTDKTVEILNKSSITDTQLQELSDSDYLDRLDSFYWFIKLTYQKTLIIPESEMGVSSLTAGNTSIARNSDSHGLADGASGVSCPI